MLLVDIQDSLHCKQGSYLQLPVVYETESTTSFQHNYTIVYKYHHGTKPYQKISRVCCRLYCYECAAQVTMPTATNE